MNAPTFHRDIKEHTGPGYVPHIPLPKNEVPTFHQEILREEAVCFPKFPPYKLFIFKDTRTGKLYAVKNREEAEAVLQTLLSRRYEWRQY
jgi:hypothetical protein